MESRLRERELRRVVMVSVKLQSRRCHFLGGGKATEGEGGEDDDEEKEEFMLQHAAFMDQQLVADIKTFANAVALDKPSIYPSTQLFTTGETGLVSQLRAAGLDVYAYVLRNEFVSQPWDFLSDPTVEINAYVAGAGVDGIITDFPGTTRRYKSMVPVISGLCHYLILKLSVMASELGNKWKEIEGQSKDGSSCRNLGSDVPIYMQPIEAGQLLSLMTPNSLPPALSPIPPLTVSDVVEPPLPSVSRSVSPGAAPASLQPSSGQRDAFVRAQQACYRYDHFVSLPILFGSTAVVAWRFTGGSEYGREGKQREEGGGGDKGFPLFCFCTFKKMAPKAIKEIRKFAQKTMGTTDIRVDVKLNKHIWSRGIRSVPRRVRVRIARKRNDEEDAKEELYSLVTVAEIPPEGLKGLGTKVVDEAD
ncbi:hypothetical protein ZIOFF_068303 [Zingiber officinale]|uniref:glycerophosphodiester phosphodiesterase n=1 Tax=Zingiber officinale TaxID=94328 RepID=A0A8J5CGG8_ZINOF|nr:hypothetical protein ZIOFF_068303 [Zingiber officinale]